jgi:quercetin dioxygenase-like cupin family protein
MPPANQRTSEKVVAVRSSTARRLLIAAAVAALAIPAGVAVATPPQDPPPPPTPTPIARGTFSERAKIHTSNIKAKIKPSDFVVLSLHFAPGATTGWHSHPGPAMVVVQEGTFTLYNASDRKCRPHRYGPGQAFVDRGGGNVHIGRNETDRPVRVVVTFVIPVGAAPTISAPNPGTCRGF